MRKSKQELTILIDDTNKQSTATMNDDNDTDDEIVFNSSESENDAVNIQPEITEKVVVHNTHAGIYSNTSNMYISKQLSIRKCKRSPTAQRVEQGNQ